MNTNLQAAMDIIDHSSLSPEDQSLWHDKLKTAPETLVQLFIEWTHDDPEILKPMTDNLRQKAGARSAHDFSHIVAHEQSMLQAITH